MGYKGTEVGNETWFEVVERVGMDNPDQREAADPNTREVYEKDLPNGSEHPKHGVCRTYIRRRHYRIRSQMLL